jgi:hypothetical protein
MHCDSRNCISARNSKPFCRFKMWYRGIASTLTDDDEKHGCSIPVCNHSDHYAELGIYIKSNGNKEFRLRCSGCAKPHQAIRKTYAKQLIEHAGMAIEFVTDGRDHKRVCVVCDCEEIGTEMHHFAPRNIFGSECNDWPYLPLCREHHRYWHNKMNGYQTCAKSAETECNSYFESYPKIPVAAILAPPAVWIDDEDGYGYDDPDYLPPWALAMADEQT